MKKLLSIMLSVILLLSCLTVIVSADAGTVGVTYQAHVQNIGWQNWVSDGQDAGTSGQSLRVEALNVKLVNAPVGASIKYQAHVQNVGWQNWVSDGQSAGTSGQGLRVEAIRISLVNMPGYSVQYQAHVQDIGWQNWVSDGQDAGTSGQSLRVEALRIRIVKNDAGVTYQAHVQNIGWQNWVSDGQDAGTSGMSLRVEALNAKLVNAPAGASIKYQAHVQNIGWQNWVSDGQSAGTSGQGLRVEAIRISLVNMPGYSVQYQAHVQNVGWQNWVSDGQDAGTSGQGLRVEALRIRIVKNISVVLPEITKVNSTISGITVENGTAFKSIGLPVTVEVNLDNGSTASVPVNWASTAYNPTAAGSYGVQGTLAPLPDTAANTKGIKLSVIVTVKAPPEITGVVATIPDFKVTNGTSLAKAGLPSTVTVNLNNGKTAPVSVNWLPADPLEYVPANAGTYTLSGIMIPAAGILNSSNIKASAKIIVAPSVAPSDPKPNTPLNTNPGTIIDELDDTGWTADANCIALQNKANFVSGTASINMTSNIAAGGGEFYISKPVTANLSTMDNIEFNFYIPDPSQITAIYARLFHDSDSAYYEIGIGNWELSPGWNTIRKSIPSTDAAALANVSSVRFAVQAAAGQKPSISVDKFSYNVRGTAKLLFTFDDGWLDTLTYAKPVLDKYGFKGTVYACQSIAEGTDPLMMRDGDLSTISAAGWDIGNHTVSHHDDINLLTDAQIQQEYGDNQTWITTKWPGNNGAYHAAYPSGSFNDGMIEILKKTGVKTGRCTVAGDQPAPVGNIYKLKCQYVEKGNVAEVEAAIDEAVKTGSTLILMIHKVEPLTTDNVDLTVSQTNLDAIAAYASTKYAVSNVVTISQWYASYMGNAIP